MDADALTFGPWLQRRRRALHLTQPQLGRRAGCAADTIGGRARAVR
jgi:transcriptional regulator with XRE-family HTH domain